MARPGGAGHGEARRGRAREPMVHINNDDIKAIMRQHGERSTAFAKRFGVSPRTVQNWQQGRTRPNPTAMVTLLSLLEQLRTSNP